MAYWCNKFNAHCLLSCRDNSDHDTIHLITAYRPKIQTEPVAKKSLKVWSPECVDVLQGCFDCIDWGVFFDACDNVHDATEAVSDCISFCEDMIIPTKTINIFPNNKPWITKSLKTTLNEKKSAFQARDRLEIKRIQTKQRKEIKESKRQVQRKG